VEISDVLPPPPALPPLEDFSLFLLMFPVAGEVGAGKTERGEGEERRVFEEGVKSQKSSSLCCCCCCGGGGRCCCGWCCRCSVLQCVAVCCSVLQYVSSGASAVVGGAADAVVGAVGGARR